MDWDSFIEIIERHEYQEHKAYYHNGQTKQPVVSWNRWDIVERKPTSTFVTYRRSGTVRSQHGALLIEQRT